jgi:ribonucleoside-diphosphate reductase alpha chain
MNGKNKNRQTQLGQFTLQQIAKATFAAAERMGISDRAYIENLTQQVIERLEKKLAPEKVNPVQPLPGMEDMVGRPNTQEKRVPTNETEILALVKEFLDAEEPIKKQEDVKSMKTTKADEMENKQNDDIKLTENALKVLEKRYLKKDKSGKPTETPEQLFRRVARAIAAADIIYDPRADIGKGKMNFTAQW